LKKAELPFVNIAPAKVGIRLRKVPDRRKQAKVFGCFKGELGDRGVAELLVELRGPVDLPKKRALQVRTGENVMGDWIFSPHLFQPSRYSEKAFPPA